MDKTEALGWRFLFDFVLPTLRSDCPMTADLVSYDFIRQTDARLT